MVVMGLVRITISYKYLYSYAFTHQGKIYTNDTTNTLAEMSASHISKFCLIFTLQMLKCVLICTVV